MKGFISHLAYDFKSGIRDKTLMLMNYIFPLGFFFIPINVESKTM